MILYPGFGVAPELSAVMRSVSTNVDVMNPDKSKLVWMMYGPGGKPGGPFDVDSHFEVPSF